MPLGHGPRLLRVSGCEHPRPLGRDVEFHLPGTAGRCSFQGLDDQPQHRIVAVPLTVGGDDVPGRCSSVLHRSSAIRHASWKIGPQQPVVHVAAWVVLPVLVRVLEPGQQPLALLGGRDVQEALDDHAAVVGQRLLEAVDAAVAAADVHRQRQLAHLGDEHVLVLRTVEDADLSSFRHTAGTCQRKSCSSSSGVGALKALSRVPLGSSSPTTWRTVPPLPDVSMPCNTSSTRRTEAPPAAAA